MSVLNVEEYTQKNGEQILKVILNPTKNFPEGKNYFYAPAEAIDLVNEHTWYLTKSCNGIYIKASLKTNYTKKILFHKALFIFYKGYNWNNDIDHINQCESDNTDCNLNAVTQRQNSFNKFTRSYFFFC